MSQLLLLLFVFVSNLGRVRDNRPTVWAAADSGRGWGDFPSERGHSSLRWQNWRLVRSAYELISVVDEVDISIFHTRLFRYFTFRYFLDLSSLTIQVQQRDTTVPGIDSTTVSIVLY